MMGALVSQHFRTAGRTLWPTMGLMLLVTVVSFAAVALRIPVLNSIGVAVGGVFTIGFIPATLVLLAVDYWRTMYGRQGYFTMAVPVRGRTLFWSKALHALISSAIAIALTLVGMLLYVIADGIAQRTSLADSFRSLWDTVRPLGTTMIWFLAATLLIQLVFTVIAGGAVMSIGAEGRFNHLGAGAPVIGGVILYFVMQTLGLVTMLFLPLGVRVSGPEAGSFTAQGMWPDFVAAISAGTGPAPDPQILGVGIVPVTVAVTVALAWWAVRSIERRTSLR